MGDAGPSRYADRFVTLWRAGLLPAEALHTRTLPLAEINQALDALATGQALRQTFPFQ